MPPKFLTPKIIEKSWGRESVIINDDWVCGKYLIYDKADNYSSFHFHGNKNEIFVCVSGSFNFIYKNEIGNTLTKLIKKDDIIYIPSWTPHQLKALENSSIILEISSHDDPNDIVRIEPSMPKN